MNRQVRKPIRLGTTAGARRLKKRLKRRLVTAKPILVPAESIVEGSRKAGLSPHLFEFGLTRKQLRGKRVLFVGSGCGKVIEEARNQGIKAFGVEPEPRDTMHTRTMRTKRFVTKNIIQNFVPKKPYDYVIAYWSVPLWVEKAYDKRLSFFRMLSSLKVGGKLFVFPIIFKGREEYQARYGNASYSLKRKIEKAGFKTTPKEYDILIIEKTPHSDLRKLQKLLSL